MSDPTRLSDSVGEDVTGLERELLRAGRQERLPARDRGHIWAGVSLQILPPVAPGDPGVGAAAGAATVAKAAVGAKALGAGAAVKGTILAVALGGGSVAGYQAVKHRAAPVAPVALTAPAPAPRAPEAPEPFDGERLAAARAPRSPLAPRGEAALRSHSLTKAIAPSRLAAEGRVVLDARQALRDGRAGDALRVLEAARAEFAAGALVQEREALAIEALARAGRREDAARRAAVFLRAYPGSPHAATVGTFTTP